MVLRPAAFLGSFFFLNSGVLDFRGDLALSEIFALMTGEGNVLCSGSFWGEWSVSMLRAPRAACKEAGGMLCELLSSPSPPGSTHDKALYVLGRY